MYFFSHYGHIRKTYRFLRSGTGMWGWGVEKQNYPQICPPFFWRIAHTCLLSIKLSSSHGMLPSSLYWVSPVQVAETSRRGKLSGLFKIRVEIDISGTIISQQQVTSGQEPDANSQRQAASRILLILSPPLMGYPMLFNAVVQGPGGQP